MKKLRLTLPCFTLALAVMAIAAPGASAHPLGNFSVNHLTTVAVSADRIELRYVLDQAEIPTVQERGLSRAEVLRRKRQEVARNLTLEVNGSPVPLTMEPGGTLAYRPGAGGLETTRVELELAAALRDPRTVVVRDGTFDGRIGWKAIVSRPGEGTAVRTDAPTGDPTDGLRRYPQDLLSSPLDRRYARFAVKPGEGTLVAPVAEGEKVSTTRSAGDGFAGLFESAAAGDGVLVIMLLAAFGWGAFHAVSPGHGKAMVAAYLVGTRGRARHALALGATLSV
jgi:nickel/cobalt exporter